MRFLWVAMIDRVTNTTPTIPTHAHQTQGIDDEPVVAKTEAQSFGSFKSFDEVHKPEGVQAWLQVLAADLVRAYH